MSDKLEQELIDILKEANRKWYEAYHKWVEANHKWDEADRKWDEADRNLCEYRKRKAQRGGEDAR